MTLAIAHKTTTPDKRVIVDAVRGVRPPFSPSAVVDDFATLLKSYRVSKVVGDHYGGEFVKEPFRRHGISYELCNSLSPIYSGTCCHCSTLATSPCRAKSGSSLRSSAWRGGCRGPAATASTMRRAHTMILPMPLAALSAPSLASAALG